MKKFLIWTGRYYEQVVLSKKDFETLLNEKILLNLNGEMVTGKEFDE